ncbi:MAG: acyl carrier protein [Planctomycetes bacterium]|nr:acyl carrier protein [Planctomycetota bacterium]
MAMSEQEIFGKVKETLVEALSVDEEEVKPNATLTGDLGAESIDFLDIVFRLEKAFNIKIPRGELFPDNVLNNPEYVQDGRLTPAGLKTLKERMVHADLTEFEKDPSVSKLAEQFKVQTIVNYVRNKVKG